MVTNPSIVIGVGEAGCKMATQTYNSIVAEASGDKDEAAEVLDRFKFVGIDTKADELEAYTPDAFETYALETPTQYWEDDVEDYPYLREGMRLTDVGGATRQRAVSRYYIDNLVNYDDFYYKLQQIVEEFEDMTGEAMDSDEIDAANIWVINSFGGGTGSGAYPLITGMLDQITDAASEEYYLCGIGSLPRINQLDERTPPPNANVSFYANAYTALRELSVLLDYNFADGFTDADGENFPLTIPVYATRKKAETRNGNPLAGFKDIRMERPPFDFYGLIGFDEEEANESSDYSENLNQVAADLIRLMAETYDEDFPDGYSRDGGEKPTLFAVDSRGVEVPVTAVENYIESLEDIGQIDDRISNNKDELTRLRENRDYINQVRDIDPGTNPYENEDDEQVEQLLVAKSIIERAQESADEVDPRQQFHEDRLDERFDDAFSEVGRLPAKYDVNVEEVFSYLYYQEVVSELRSMQNGHQFAQLVEEAIDTYGNKFSSYLDSDQVETIRSNATPIEKWNSGLEEFFEAAIADQETKLEQTSRLKVRLRREIQERIQRLQSTREDLVDQYVEYQNIEDAKNFARGRRNEAQTTLEDHRSRVSEEIRTTEEKIETLEEERGRLENVQETRKETLSSYDRERYSNIPFQNFEKASLEFLSNLKDISDLLDKRVITDRKVARGLEYQLKNLEEPLQNLDSYNVPVAEYSHVGALVNGSNAGLLSGELDDVEGIDDISSKLSSVADEQEQAIVNDPFRIRLTRTTADIALENTSEFGQIHTYYSDSERNVGDLLGSGSSDTELIAKKFGYPEFFPDDQQIREVLGSGKESPEPVED